jgi:S1-C subfamily serine protease
VIKNILIMDKVRIKGFIKRFTKELIIALVLAMLAGIIIEWWIHWSRKQAIQRNLKAVATILVYGKDHKLISQGSGFFINSTGLLATNGHVVNGAADIIAQLPSGAFYDYREIKSTDPDADIAILQFDAKETPTVSGMGNSDELFVGQTVYALGTPIGQEGTVSGGNVSNPSQDLHGRKFIQFTAPISPGSSGGGLFNDDGEVIGITAASLNITYGSQAGQAQNINFAVPINDVKTVVSGSQNLSHGSATYYYAQGLLADDQKLFDTAIVFFKKAIELNEKYTDAYIGLAYVYYEKGEFELEVQYNYQATLADTSNAEAFYCLGTSYEDIGQYNKAIVAYKKSLSLNPNKKDTLHDLAVLYLAKGDKESAANLIAQLKDLDRGWGFKLEVLMSRLK